MREQREKVRSQEIPVRCMLRIIFFFGLEIFVYDFLGSGINFFESGNWKSRPD